MKYIIFTVLLLALFNFKSSFGQEYYTAKVTMKNGIYLSVDEFRKNAPSLPLSAIHNQKDEILESSFCTDKISYISNGEIKYIKSKEIWGLSINGMPYVNHQEKGLFKPNNCFYRIFKIGALSTYFIQEFKDVNSNSWGLNSFGGINYAGTPRDVKVKVTEYAIDLETGDTYEQKGDARKIINIIKRDEYFRTKKIKKKDIGIFITQYNQRNPLDVEVN